MRIYLHIGPEARWSERIQQEMAAQRDRLASRGVLYARTPGARNHTRLYLGVSDPDRIDSLRHHRGVASEKAQAAMRHDLASGLAAEIGGARPSSLVLTAHQLGSSLVQRSEIERLRALLMPFSSDIRIVAHVDDPARMLARAYAGQLMEGRSRPLDLELNLVGTSDWWRAALATRPIPDPLSGVFGEVQGAVFWLDYGRLAQEWDAVFGNGATRLISLPRDDFPAALSALIHDSFDLDITASDRPLSAGILSAAWLARCRQFNEIALRYQARKGLTIPRQLWRKLLGEMRVPGAPVDPGGLFLISEQFASDIKALCAVHPGLDPVAMRPDAPAAPWREADPSRGFRATQYLLAFTSRIGKAAGDARRDADGQTAPPDAPTDLPPAARRNFARLKGSPFAPHNRLGSVDEEALAAAYPLRQPRDLPSGCSGRVIVGCMKNEAPYVLEWIAHHRAIGVDGFLIYSNGCEDGTDVMLDRLQALGLVEHRRNDDWSGKSPQQAALNLALDEPILRRSEWIIHIDVDEFINVRCGDGTLDAFLDRVPDATNVAMTWRLFGHNGVNALQDALVIDQFDTCAPTYCPKPHTAWGFKTMFRNIGAYAKMSCHRPNKLSQAFEAKVKWVNGSGQDITRETAHNGWRNSRRSIGYDLLQLNHYALRSAESFLIKRQRGRALHVDRAIGLNYWIRMDWSGARDVTIKRNLPRLRAEFDHLKSDPVLAGLHGAGFDWHRAKAQELHDIPEFRDLYRQALALRLDETQRAAYALALDAES